MMSPQGYLCDLLIQNLNNWCENVVEESVKVGILSQNVRLSNLVLREQSWPISKELKICLKYGTLGLFSLQFPLSKIHLGCLNIEIDDIHIVLSIEANDAATIPLNNAEQLESIFMREVECINQNAEANKNPSSWLGSYLKSFTQTLLAKFVANSTVTAHNIDVSVLIPQFPADKCAHFKFPIQSIIILPKSKREADLKSDSTTIGKMECFLGKDISICNFSLYLQYISSPKAAEDYQLIVSNQFGTNNRDSIVLNSTTMSMQLWCKKLRGTPFSMSSIRALVMEASSHNMEWSPSKLHLLAISGLFSSLSAQILRKKVQYFFNATAGGVLRGKVLFQCVANTILTWIRFRRRGFRSASLYYDVYKLNRERLYRDLYFRILQSRLANFEAYPVKMSFGDTLDFFERQFEGSDLSEAEKTQFSTLSLSINCEEQYQLRVGVHKDILSNGSNHPNSLIAAVLNNPRPKNWLNSFIGDSNSSYLAATAVQNMAIDGYKKEPDEAATLIFEMTICLSRLSISIMEPTNALSEPDKPVNNIFQFETRQLNHWKLYNGGLDSKSALSLVVYGIYAAIKSDSDSCKSVQVSLGVVKMFGFEGEELLLCGDDSLDWLNMDLNRTDECQVNDQAFRAKFRTFSFPAGHRSDADNECVRHEDYSDDKNEVHHQYDAESKVCIGFLQAKISTKSVIFIRQLIDSMIAPVSIAQQPLALYESQINDFADQKKLLATDRKPESRHRLDFEMRGVSISVPIEKNASQHSPTRGTQDFHRTSAKVATDPRKHYLQLSIGEIFILSGEDSLVGRTQVEDKSAPARITSGSAKASISKASKTSDLKSAASSAKPDDSIEVSKFSNRLLAKIANVEELPIIFSIAAISLIFLETEEPFLLPECPNHGLESVVSEPWSISGAYFLGAAFHSLSSRAHIQDTTEYVTGDLLVIDASALVCNLSSQSILDIQSVYNEVITAIQPNRSLKCDLTTAADNPYSCIRFNGIADKPILSLDLCWDGLTVKLFEVTSQTDTKQEMLQNIIYSYCGCLQLRGNKAFVKEVKRSLCLRQLLNMGIDKDFAEKILTESEVNVRGEDLATSFERVRTIISSTLLTEATGATESLRAIICSMTITLLCVQSYNLVYDNVAVVSLDSILLNDSNYCPMFSVERSSVGKVDNDLERSKRQDAHTRCKTGSSLRKHTVEPSISKRDKAGIEYLIDLFENASSGLKIFHISKDADNHFGQGGLKISEVLGEKRFHCITSKYYEVESHSECLEVFFSSTVAVQMLEKTASIKKLIESTIWATPRKEIADTTDTHTVPHRHALNKNTQSVHTLDSYSSRYSQSESPTTRPTQGLVPFVSVNVNMQSVKITLAAGDNAFVLQALMHNSNLEINDVLKSKQERSSEFRIQSLQLFDLTPLGSMHHEVIWSKRHGRKGEKWMADSSEVDVPLIEGICREYRVRHDSDDIDVDFIDVTGTVNHLRVCFLYRFIIDIVNYISVYIIEPISKNASKLPNEEVPEFDIRILPDDSETEDDSSSNGSDNESNARLLYNKSISYSFLSSDYSDSPINNRRNATEYQKPSHTSSPVPAPSLGASTVQETPINDNISSAFKCCFTVNDLTAYAPRNSNSKDCVGVHVETVQLKISQESNPWMAPTDVELSNNGEIDENSSCSLYFDTDANTWKFSSHADDVTAKRKEDFNSINNVLRISLIASSANAFASISQPLRKSSMEKQFSNHPEFFEEEHLFLEIFEKESVYEMKKVSYTVHTRKHSPHSSQLWQRISSDPFNFRMVLDFTSDQVKLLFSDDEVFSQLNFQVSQSELYLIIAIWSENVCECSQFAADESPSVSGENVKTDPNPTLHSLAELETAYSAYGSKRYCDFLMHRKDWFELLVTRQIFTVKCAIDTNYFPRNIPSDECLASIQEIYRSDWPSAATSPSKAPPLRRKFSFISGKEWKCRVKPIADVECSSFLLHLKMDYDCIQMSLSTGDITVKDLREPAKSLHDVVFSVHHDSASSAKTGYCSSDFQYGFNLLPSSILTSSKPAHPFQMSLISSSISNWMTINIGLDSSNLNLLNMDMVWLISEFVSCYFRFPEYGHPALKAFEKLKKNSIPYGGIDTRLFVTNPHITLIRHPLLSNSEVLQLETNKGVFFRYALDTTSSVKMELSIYDIAVVLVRRYLVPEKARGLRGASGSGRGIRTLLEYFSLQLIYQFVAEENHLDVKLDCFGHSDEKYNHQFDTSVGTAGACVDLNAEELRLKPGKVLNPTCLISPVLLSTKFRPDSSDIVTCYEDFILCNDLFTNFLGLKGKGIKDAADDEKPKCSLFMVMSVTGVRIMIVDNVLGLHLPLIQVFVDNVATTLFRAKGIENKPKAVEEQSINMKNIGFSFSKSQSIYASGVGIIDQSDSGTSNDGAGIFAGLASLSNQEQQSKLTSSNKPVITYPVSLSIDSIFSMEYFNNLKKCWEPLLNKLYTTAMFENSDIRGNGYSAKFHNAVHFNLSGALIRTLNDLLRTTQLTESGSADNDVEGGAYDNELASSWDKRHSRSSRMWKVCDPSSSIFLGGADFIANNGDDQKLLAFNTSDTFKSISHIQSSPLDPAFRVGFSVYNLTGQGIRYLQLWDGGRITIQYLNDKERGLLNFISSLTSIRNGTLVEVPFDVQLEKGGRKQFRNRKKAVGNRVALQVSGFDWLRSVQADELGIQFYDVIPVLGRRFELPHDDNDTILKNALKLVAEVVPYCGGRMLRLRSVFSIKNNTEHSLSIKIQDDSADSVGDEIDLKEFRLESNGTYFVPLSLLYRSIRSNHASGNSDLLGSIKIRPAELPPIINGLQKNLADAHPSSVDYSTDPINLYQNIVGTSQVSDGDDSGGQGQHKDLMQLRCDVKSHLDNIQTVSRGGFNMKTFSFDTERVARFPPVCYNVEIIRESSDAASEVSNAQSDKTNLLTALFPVSGKDSKNDFNLSPNCYTIVIHPPIILENLLPVDAVFEILHATHKTVLWSSQLRSEAIVPIHTVTLDQPLSLMIKANYCCASEGIIFHESNTRNQQKKSKIGNWKSDFEPEILDVILSDTVGQRLRVHVENIEGGGGQRHLIVFCPFLILNTSQYSFRVREEGHTSLPAGTVSEKKDGSREMPGSNIIAHSDSNLGSENHVAAMKSLVQERLTKKANSPYDLASSVSSSNDNNDLIIPPSGSSKSFEHARTFPGKISAFHSNSKLEVSIDWRKHHFLESLTFEEIKNYSYMFNYSEASSYILGGRKVKIQFDDSNWSNPFSLDSVGVNQVISINHKTGCYEAGFNIMVAPGKMSKYTKIVRFLPHYTLVNKLSTSIRVFQPSGFAGQDLESEVLSGCIRPYHLPSVNGRRNIGVKIEGPWNSTVAFPIDRIGTYVMSIRRQLPAVHHVNTRGEAVYTVHIPNDCSKLGLWLETDWGAESILVKRIKPGSFAANSTKIHVGDVLIAINDLDVTRKSFNEVMEEFNKISSRERENNFLTFRTLEERLKLIREMANSKSSVKKASTSVESVSTAMKKAIDDSGKDHRALDEFKLLKVEFRQFESSVAITVDEVTDDSTIEYRIDNKSLCYMLYYKQKGIVGNKWYTLNPGQTAPFAWEDPFGPHRLSIIVGHNVLAPYSSPDMVSTSSLFLFSAEQNSAIFDFDKSEKSEKTKPVNSIPIQFRDPKHPKALQGIVKSGGHCKILEVSPIGDKDQYLAELDYCRRFCENQVATIENFLGQIVDTIKNSYEKDEIVATETIREIKSSQQEICKSLEEDFVSKQIEAALGKKDSESVEDTMFRAVEKLQMEELSKLGCVEMNQLQPSDLRKLEAHVQSHKSFETLKLLAPESLKNIEQEAKLKYDAAQLVSYIPFEKMFESGLSAQNQLIVNVLEARDLTPTVVGKVEDVYCKVYLDLRNSTVPNIFRNWRRAYRTYICEQTMDPSWLYQNFLLELPANAKTDSRQLYIRVDVLAQSSIGLDQVLGRADIQLSSLENEKELSGWFPLRYNSNSALLNEDGYAESMTGSIKLSLQWIHSLKGLTDHFFEASYRRLLELQLHKKVLNFCNDFHRKTETFKIAEPKLKENKNFKRDNYYTMHLRHVKNLTADEYLEKQLRETSISRSADGTRNCLRVNFTDDQTQRNINFGLVQSSPSFDVTHERVVKGFMSASRDTGRLRSGSHCSALETVSRVRKSKAKFDPLLLDTYPLTELTPLSDIFYSHDKAYQIWAEQFYRKYNHIHQSMKKFMLRSCETVEEETVFVKRFDEECTKTFTSLHLFQGKVEVTPLQAQNLPDSRNAVFVRISYGDKKFDTISMPPASFLSWHQESMDDNFSHYASNLKDGDNKQKFTNAGSLKENSFPVDTLNISGTIKVRIMAEGFPKATTLAEVNIPVFNLLQCISDCKDFYERWFPLTLYEDIAVGEGELEKMFSSYATEQISPANLGNKPCINLRLRWIPSEKRDEDLEPQVSKMYSRFQMPALTLAVIDSDKAAELLQVSLMGLELRRTVTDNITNTNVNITWIQVDNELRDTEAPVIMCPTFKKYPQPVVRLHIGQNNNHENKNIDSYHTIQLCIQELDVKLEQQTVLASWDLLKGWLDERKSDHEGSVLYSESEIIVKSNSEKENLLTDGFKLWESYGNFFNRKSSTGSSYEDRKISVDNFIIHSVKLNVSFITSPHVRRKQTSTRQQSLDIRNQGIIGLYSTLSMFIWQVGEVILSLTSTISNTSIEFAGFIIYDMFNKSASETQQILQDHYLNTAWNQLYKIAGSLELVGVNPIGLLSSLSIGVVSFFYEPAHAIITSPTEFRKIGKGVFKGTVSLVSNVSVGLLGTSIGVTQSASRIASKVTMDEFYMKAREKLQRPPRTLGGVITRPMKDIGTGVYYASTGLVKLPYVGYCNQGIPGLVKGAGKGLGGAFTKPVVGIFDACSHSFSGAKDLIDVVTINSAHPVPRLRLSDLFGPDGRILPYNYANSLGLYLLQLLEQSNEEEFVSTAIHDGMGILNMCGKVFESSSVKNRASPSEQGTGTRASGRIARRYSVVTKPTRAFARQDVSKYLASQKSDEYVISTSLFRDSEKIDKAVVITTFRVVVMGYRRHNLRSTFNALWECPLEYLVTPQLRWISGEVQFTFKLLNPSPKGSAISEFLERAVHTSRTKKTTGHYEYTLTCKENDEEVFRNMENTIKVLLHDFDSVSDRKILLNHNASTLCEKIEEGRVDIGAWQYIHEETYYADTVEQLQQDFSQEGLNYEIYEQLGVEPWKKSSSSQSTVPNWLKEERHKAEQAHCDQYRYQAVYDSIKETTSESIMLMNNFERGLLSPDEFLSQAENFVSCFEQSDSNNEDTSKCSESDTSRYKKKVGWSIGRSVMSFAVHSGQSINSNLSKLVSRKAKMSYKGSHLSSDRDAIQDTVNDRYRHARPGTQMMHISTDNKEPISDAQAFDDIPDDESYSTCASSARGILEKSETRSAAKSAFLLDEEDFHHDNDSRLEIRAEVLPSKYSNSDHNNSGDHSPLPIEPNQENLQLQPLRNQHTMKSTIETSVNPSRPQQLLTMQKPNASRLDTDMLTSHIIHAHHRRPSGLLAEVNPMIANKLPLNPARKDGVAHCIASSGMSVSQEVNYGDIYSSLQVVNGVVSTPPARLVDAVAAPVDAADLTILLLNERINRLENIILTLHPTSSVTIPSSAASNSPARALEFTESSDIHYGAHHEASHFDYLVDSMPYSSSLDPTIGSPQQFAASSNATEEIEPTDK